MSIKLWDWLEDLNWLVGADFPEADEDALWRCSDAWAGAAAELRRLSPEVVLAGERVTGALGGESGDAFADLWRQYAADDGLVARVAAACEQLAAACDGAAIEVEYAKIQYIAALVVLAAALAALTACLVAGGVSALGMPVAVAAAQFAIRMILIRLVTAMAVGAVVNVALDGLAQSIQLLAGHRHEWDLAKTERAAEDGAIYGVAGGGVFLAAARFAPALLRTPLRLAVPLAGTGAVGGVAAPLVHGELPTGRDFLLAVTSGIAGGLGPDLVHGRASTPNLSRLDTLDTDGIGHGSGAGTLTYSGGLGIAEGGFGGLFGDDRPADPGTVGSGSSAAPAPGSGRHDALGPDDPGQLTGGALREPAHLDPPAGFRPDHGGERPDSGAGSASASAGPADRMLPMGRTDMAATPGVAPLSVVGPAHPVASSNAPRSAMNATATNSTVTNTAAANALATNGGATNPTAPGTAGPNPIDKHATAAVPIVGNAAGAATPGTGSGGQTVPGGPASAAGHAGSPVPGASTADTATLIAVGTQPMHTGGISLAAPDSPASTMDRADWLAREAGADLPGWSDGDEVSLTGPQNQAAGLMLERARAVEPRITEVARDIAREVGGTLFGEENKLKTADSFKSKLAQNLVDFSLSEALAKMKDTVRYTVGLPEDGYARGSQDAVSLLLNRGFRPVGERTSWGPQPGYLGFNTFWSDPVSGHVFEVQFHTESSYVAKTLSHPILEELRQFKAKDHDTPAYLVLKAAHDVYFVDVPVPAGARDVRIPEDVPRYDPRGDVPPLLRQRSADGPELPTVDDGPGPSSTEDGPSLPDGDDGRRPATDTEARDLARQNVFDTNAGLAFYAADDEVRDFARAVQPTDGYVTLDLHGSSQGFQIGNGLLTPTQFADALRDLRDTGVLNLPAGVGIKLLSCDTARGGLYSPAAVLARRLGVEVIAPDQPVWTALDGDEVVSSPTLVNGNLVPGFPPDGTWFRFIPVPAATPGGPQPNATAPARRDGGRDE